MVVMMQLASSNPGGMPGSNGNDFPMKTMDQAQQQMPSYQANGSLSTPGSLPPNSPLSSHQSGGDSLGLTSPGFVSGSGPEMGGASNIPPGPASQVGGTVAGGTNPAAAAPKRPVRRGGKPQPERPVRALFCLGLKNPIRKLCIDITEWK